MKKLYFAAVAGNLGILSVGINLGWASPSLPLLINGDNDGYPVRLTMKEASWVVSLFFLSTSGGCVIPALIVNTIGRKNTMLLGAAPSIIGYLMIIFATSSWELYVSRFILGITGSISLTVTPMYLGEISPADVRGILGSMMSVALNLGTLIEFMIGPFVSVKNLALISLVGPCLFLITFIWLPESPYHWIRCDAKQKAINSLVQLRDKEDVYKEADSIEQSVKADLANKAGFRELLFTPGNRRALITVVCLCSIQQLSGIQAVLQYAQMIFDHANGKLEGKYLTMILGAVQLVCAVVCMMIIDRSGRKPLLTISAIGTACSSAIVASYFHLQYYHVDTSNIVWLPAICVILYIIMHSLGLGALPLTMASEMFPTNVKTLGIMTSVMMLNFIGFSIAELYPVISEKAGIHTPFWIFTACNLAGAVFTLLYVIETKGKTLEQIQEELHDLSKQKVKSEIHSNVDFPLRNF
ncbi:facilitated trehalose transporter Tret1 isoform X1 [Solenopsis invicta]|uniref:facilitated trehalose transporter Tret1 isoform X1 n=2 Tax=Solenopsis invicta TaxID=13686 RepID=UPI00193D7F90|nr:facilitated trehalose transporter Tret1 isoform X1 [Solenopsis invicta]XP_011164055.2 facilitated trehalose transporter Tret1 isoform X1 [Solenopsis invicta]